MQISIDRMIVSHKSSIDLARDDVEHIMQSSYLYNFICPTNEQVVRKSDASQIQQNDRILITESLNIISSPSFQFKLQMFMTV